MMFMMVLMIASSPHRASLPTSGLASQVEVAKMTKAKIVKITKKVAVDAMTEVID